MSVSPNASNLLMKKGAVAAAFLLMLLFAALLVSTSNSVQSSNKFEDAQVAANELIASNPPDVQSASGLSSNLTINNQTSNNVTSSVQTSISIKVQPVRVALGNTVKVNMAVSPPPPTADDVYGNLTLLILLPDGTAALLGPFLTDSAGSLSVSYAPDMIGSYGIRAIYSGQFASWNITYLGAESTEITLTVLSDVTPKTWTVDDDGPADFRTIQEAINAAEEGDTILVMSGFYREAVVVNKTLSLQGTNKRDTIIDGNNSWTVVTVWANSSSISGFTIQNSGDYPEGLIIEYSSGNSIHGNTIKNSGNRGIEINQINNEVTDNEVLNAYYGILLMSSSNNSVANNKVVNSVYGIMLYEGCQNNTVHANNISLCRNAGIVVGPVPAGGSYAKSYGNLLSENTLLGNGDGICLGGASYGNTVVGNIIRENAQGVYLQGTVDNK